MTPLRDLTWAAVAAVIGMRRAGALTVGDDYLSGLTLSLIAPQGTDPATNHAEKVMVMIRAPVLIVAWSMSCTGICSSQRPGKRAWAGFDSSRTGA